MLEAFSHYSPAFWISALVSVTLIGISKAGFGAGIGAYRPAPHGSDIFPQQKRPPYCCQSLLSPISWPSISIGHVGNLSIVLLLLPVSYLGVKLGFLLNQRCSDKWFKRLIYGLLFLTGIQLLFGIDIVGMLK